MNVHGSPATQILPVFSAPISLEAAKLLLLKYGTSPAPPRPEIVMGSHLPWLLLGPMTKEGAPRHSPDLSPTPHVCAHPPSKTRLPPLQFPSTHMLFSHFCLYKHQPPFRCGPVTPSRSPSIWWPCLLTSECCCPLAQPFTRLACAAGVCVSFPRPDWMSPPRAAHCLAAGRPSEVSASAPHRWAPRTLVWARY